MRRNTYFRRTQVLAGIKTLSGDKYEVIAHYYTAIPRTGQTNYIQVVKNRKKIANFQDKEQAQRRMFAAALTDINQLKIQL